MKYSNTQGIPLPLAVWLADDDYDFVGGYKKISVTSLIKPTRRFILAGRVPMEERKYDVSDFIASRMGHAFHNAIEYSWIANYRSALERLGYPQKVIERIRINPELDPDTGEPREANILPVYLERRGERMIEDYTISGKFDMVIEGQLFDTKSTSVWSYILGKKDDDYIKQGSIYRWIFPKLITADTIEIQHIFTDYSRAQSRTQKNYPPSRMMNNTYNLIPLDETEGLIRAKTQEINKFWGAPDNEIPYCTDEELWRSAPKYKYYADPNKTDGKSTKNFDDLSEANKFRAEKGKGIVLTIPGQVKACTYCPAFPICKQKDNYDITD